MASATATICLPRSPAALKDVRVPGQPTIDRAVINAFSNGQEFESAEPYGNSAWASCIRVTATNVDGSIHEYFLKLVRGEHAEGRVRGEYTCMLELFNTMPSLVPQPRGWGRCLDEQNAYFFLCDYEDIHHPRPDPVGLAERIAELHKKSASPTGKFGLHEVPFDGKLPINVEWDSSWVSFFGKLLGGVYDLDRKFNGPWEELDDAMRITQEKVIPRLLGPLEQDGRSVKPCLIHGDLWEGNIGTDLRTGEIYIFDSCAYYAHHEMELGMWRVDHHSMKQIDYRREYFKHFVEEDLKEQRDDRNRLYSVEARLMYSAHVPGHEARVQALAELEYLVKEYAPEEVRSEDPVGTDEEIAELMYASKI